MNETEKQYDIYLSEIQKYKKRKPDYFITLRAETNEMWRTATIHKWTNLLHDFSDNIVDAFYHDNDKTGEKGSRQRVFQSLVALKTLVVYTLT